MKDIRDILRRVETGDLSSDEAAKLIGHGEVDLGFARLDMDRLRRRGMPETVYCPGKTKEQVAKIVAALQCGGQDVLATRATPDQYAAVKALVPEAVYHDVARAITVDVVKRPAPVGMVAVVCAGTSDLPVAEEAALSAERMGAKVERVFNVGVAGLHRLMKHIDLLREARVVVVVAGMEGALPSVVGGLIDKPLVAVPTSVGYGSSLNGIAALLSMLNTCVPGITVVNIDNGYGAGVAAGMINRLGP